DLVEVLASNELAGILRHALERRNAWTGHGGVAGLRAYDQRLRELEDLLGRTRGLLGWSFESWTLLKPGPMTYTRGVFDVTATILKGTNPAFRRKNIQVTEPLDVARLYLLHGSGLRVLELAPFIRVLAGATGQDACYFYSRIAGSSFRWVS